MVLAVFGLLVLGGLTLGGYYTVKAMQSMPPLKSLVSLASTGQNSVVFDRYGKKVATLHGAVNRINVNLSNVSPDMQKAIVDIEDHTFYTNPGFDLKSILRAAYVDLIHHRPVQGASTITEQLAKELYLTDKRTVIRKIQEFLIGVELARTYSKQQILQMYLNASYFGNGATGIGAASRVYFNETPNQLTLSQASLLAGLPQAPSLYDPKVNLKLAKTRQLQVLNAMVRYGDITQAQADAAYNTPFHFASPSAAVKGNASMYPYPWYIDQVIRTLEQKGFTMNQIMNGGLQIHTALDPKVYDIAQNAVDHWMNVNFGSDQKSIQNHQAAVVVEDPQNGYILAAIGGRNHVGAFPENLATDPRVHRSTGSSIKPIVDFTPAIAKGYTQMSVIQDVPIFQNVAGQAWWPQNDDHIYRGYIDLKNALAISDNDVAVHLLHDIGISYGYNFAVQKFGLPLAKSDQQNLGMAIGGLNQGVNAYEMTQAYATLANGGVRQKPIWVTQVVNQYGAIILQNVPQGTPEFSPQIAYIMDRILETVLSPSPLPGVEPTAYATGYQLGIGRPAAGKTGTNNQEQDAWFLGYTPQLVTGVWEGNPTGEIPQLSTVSGKGPAYGSVAAGPIWQTIMEQTNAALKIPPADFPRPGGLVYVPNVSIVSGKIASQYTPKKDIQGAWFIDGTQPTSVGNTFYPVPVAAQQPDRLWQPGCGPMIQSVFLRPETEWKKGAPKPYDAKYWPPTKTCSPQATSPSGLGGNNPTSPPAAPPGQGASRAVNQGLPGGFGNGNPNGPPQKGKPRGNR